MYEPIIKIIIKLEYKGYRIHFEKTTTEFMPEKKI
jgi:hypothetical protein